MCMGSLPYLGCHLHPYPVHAVCQGCSNTCVLSVSSVLSSYVPTAYAFPRFY